jgi:hypothetical protein
MSTPIRRIEKNVLVVVNVDTQSGAGRYNQTDSQLLEHLQWIREFFRPWLTLIIVNSC